jgi:hypothetical protein
MFIAKGAAQPHNKLLSLLSAALFGLLLMHAVPACAASLSFSPASGSYHVGDTINVRVTVTAPKSINAISGRIHFSPNTLATAFASKVGSLFTIWVHNPSYSNTTGNISFDGIDVNGFLGENGTVITLGFTAKAAGTATVSLSGSAVLANDGAGTNVTDSLGSASYTILPAIQKTTPSETAPGSETTTQPLEPVIVYITPPTITDYRATMVAGNYSVIKGTTTPDTSVAVTRIGPSGLAIHTSTMSDETGTFTYLSDTKLSRGTYTFMFSDIIEGTNGPMTAPIHIRVFASAFALWLTATFGIRIALYWALLGFLLLGILCFLVARCKKRIPPKSDAPQ